MESTNESGKPKPAFKGDRLNWTPLNKVKSVSLKENMNTGRRITARDLVKAAAYAENERRNYLIS